ncbi:hypothetical protein C8R46DRAFT_1092029 [Mycena filopes]|nr:hypothetical protein C8R46DRAFT_1092029 [Mycena filopes]
MTISGDLKSRGNAFFTAKDYLEAGKQYTKAIESSGAEDDPRGLAVIYANRAACLLSLKRYTDAEHDATRATKLDSTYAKGFARLAMAQDCLGNSAASAQSWRRALDALPQVNLTPGEQTQRAQYESCLIAAIASLAKPREYPKGPRRPWDRALVIMARLRVQRPINSPHIFSSEFMNGVGLARQLQLNPTTGLPAGALYGVSDISNGILRDHRVMHCPADEVVARCTEQLRFEAQVTRAWDYDRPELVIQAALARQLEEGWKAARHALSITVRGWIFHAAVETSLNQRHDIAATLYKNCLDVLSSLREPWASATPQERGIIFESSFIFGIRRNYLDALMKSEPPLEVLQQEADLLIREIDETLPQSPPQDDTAYPGFFSSFYMYPRGQAFAAKGFYHKKMAQRDGGDHFRQSALEYIKSVEFFPEDDEQHPWFLNEALESMLGAGSFAVREVLEVMRRIGASAVRAKEIWECSSLGAGVWLGFEAVVQRERRLRVLVDEGRFTMDDCIGHAAMGL